MSTLLYHVTAKSNLPGILANGLLPGSFWTTDEALADYYRETVSDEGQEPVLLAVKLEDLEPEALAPDMPGLEEPITTVLDLSEDEVWRKWQRSDQTWQESLEIVSSLCYERNIPVDLLRVATDNDDLRLADYLALTA